MRPASPALSTGWRWTAQSEGEDVGGNEAGQLGQTHSTKPGVKVKTAQGKDVGGGWGEESKGPGFGLPACVAQ